MATLKHLFPLLLVISALTFAGCEREEEGPHQDVVKSDVAEESNKANQQMDEDTKYEKYKKMLTEAVRNADEELKEFANEAYDEIKEEKQKAEELSEEAKRRAADAADKAEQEIDKAAKKAEDRIGKIAEEGEGLLDKGEMALEDIENKIDEALADAKKEVSTALRKAADEINEIKIETDEQDKEGTPGSDKKMDEPAQKTQESSE